MSITQPTLEDVWQLFRESDRRWQETERFIKEQSAETNRRFQETERRFQETERRFQESDRRFQETERLLTAQSTAIAMQMKQTDKKIRELETLFTSQWGKLVESLVEGALVRLFNDWKLPVQQTATRIKGIYQGQNYEFDILVRNGDAVVIIEVKTTLRPNHIKHFVKKLDQAKIWLPEYAHNQIHGAMAFLHADSQAEAMAIKHKLFAIRATGDSAYIVNPPSFEPRVW